MKVLMSNRLKESSIEKVKDLGYEVALFDPKNLSTIDYTSEIIVESGLIPKMGLEKFKNLKYIFLTSTGVDYLDLKYIINERNIKITNAHGAYGPPIAEWVLYNILQLEKLDRFNLKNQSNKKWIPRKNSGQLYNKKALILGTGAIGNETAKRLKAFDVETIGFNTSGRSVEHFDKVLNREKLFEILPEVEYVISTLPGTEKTKKFIDEEFISKMNKNALIINISRGMVIDEKAMIKALKEERIRGAALDVFEVEPLPETSPLWEMENVYISPHISYSSEDFEERMLSAAMDNLTNLKEGKELLNIISLKKGY